MKVVVKIDYFSPQVWSCETTQYLEIYSSKARINKNKPNNIVNREIVYDKDSHIQKVDKNINNYSCVKIIACIFIIIIIIVVVTQ